MSDRPDADDLAAAWTLDPDVAFLNHGSFGACPRAALQAQSELRGRMERQPLRFFLRELEGLFDAARERLAAFVGAEARDLVAVPNATTGVNAVVRSLRFEPGDEVLTTDHAYGACVHAARHAVESAGGRLVVAEVPFPLASPDEVVEAVLGAVTQRTRFALIDHLTSPTALSWPVERLVPELRARGVEVMVDGAHAPGMLDLDVAGLGASYYTGNLHKWCCAPKGAAFLWVRRDRQEGLFPTTISHGYAGRREGRPWLQDLFDWPGTTDPTPFLSVPAALDAVASLVPGGWPEVRRRNRELALLGRDVLCEALGVPAPCPDEMIGSMAAVPLPGEWPRRERAWALETDPLQDALLERHRVEVPISTWPSSPRRVLRISAQLYNRESEYRHLASALAVELGLS
jgi:isopenicillin-N epimerase